MTIDEIPRREVYTISNPQPMAEKSSCWCVVVCRKIKEFFVWIVRLICALGDKYGLFLKGTADRIYIQVRESSKPSRVPTEEEAKKIWETLNCRCGYLGTTMVMSSSTYEESLRSYVNHKIAKFRADLKTYITYGGSSLPLINFYADHGDDLYSIQAVERLAALMYNVKSEIKKRVGEMEILAAGALPIAGGSTSLAKSLVGDRTSQLPGKEGLDGYGAGPHLPLESSHHQIEQRLWGAGVREDGMRLGNPFSAGGYGISSAFVEANL